MPLPDEDERFVQVIEKRIKDAGLEGVTVVRGNRYPMGAGDVAIAADIQRRVDERGGQDGDYPVTVVGATGTPVRETVVDAAGNPVTSTPMMGDRQLDTSAKAESTGVVIADATHFTEDQLAALKPLRDVYAKPGPLVADAPIAADESVGEGHPPGVVMAQPVGPETALPAELVASDRPATPGELQANVADATARARASRREPANPSPSAEEASTA
ncbi:MAG TPA: hypothetical protein VKQ71_01585 [Acidimicrobiales bacterium]|nr:hypothetical protein [Acidimicrobiales bacterium]